MVAAPMGRDRKRELRRDWESANVAVMREARVAKFTPHDELAALLLATGDAKLVEHTANDSYWGDGGDGSESDPDLFGAAVRIATVAVGRAAVFGNAAALLRSMRTVPGELDVDGAPYYRARENGRCPATDSVQLGKTAGYIVSRQALHPQWRVPELRARIAEAAEARYPDFTGTRPVHLVVHARGSTRRRLDLDNEFKRCLVVRVAAM